MSLIDCDVEVGYEGDSSRERASAQVMPAIPAPTMAISRGGLGGRSIMALLCFRQIFQVQVGQDLGRAQQESPEL